jgi:predicted TIM-barrel fold metal-dependent hydrolase
MGEDLPYSLIRADTVLASVSKHLNRTIAEYFHQHFHVTTSGYFTNPPFDCALHVVGADRLMFSIDYPFSATTTGRAFLDNLSVSPTDLEKIAHGNADNLLKLTVTP